MSDPEGRRTQWGETNMKYVKTEAGQRALKARSQQLTSRQRSAMILFDGKKTVDQVLAATADLGVVSIDIDHLLALGYLCVVEGPVRPVGLPAATLAAFPAVEAPAFNKSERFVLAWPIAIRLAGALGLRGYLLKRTVEAAAGYDDLVALLPKITDAVGTEKARELRKALRV